MAKDNEDWEEEESALAKDLKDDDDEEDDKKGVADDDEEFVVVDDEDDDDDDDDEDDDDDDDDDDDERHSAYQRRIDTLTRKNAEANRRAASAEEGVTQLSQRLQTLEQANNTSDVKSFEQTYKAVRASLAKAFEDGDTEAQVALTEQMTDMRVAARAAQSAPKTPATPAAPTKTPSPPLAMAWWKKNKWFTATGNEAETAAARAIDLQIESEGYDKDDPEYYEQLDSRLQEKFPGLYKKPKKTTRKRSPSANGSGTKASKGKRNGKLVFTKSEMQMAQSLGLTNREELTAYHAEIRKSEKENS